MIRILFQLYISIYPLYANFHILCSFIVEMEVETKKRTLTDLLSSGDALDASLELKEQKKTQKNNGVVMCVDCEDQPAQLCCLQCNDAYCIVW